MSNPILYVLVDESNDAAMAVRELELANHTCESCGERANYSLEIIGHPIGSCLVTFCKTCIKSNGKATQADEVWFGQVDESEVEL